MSILPTIFGSQGMPPKQVNDPFKKECITYVNISYSKGIGTYFPDKFKGRVCFQNGSTSGEQEIKGTDLMDVFQKVAAFCESL